MTAVSPRIVCARLKLASAGQRLAGGLHRSRDVFHVGGLYVHSHCSCFWCYDEMFL